MKSAVVVKVGKFYRIGSALGDRMHAAQKDACTIWDYFYFLGNVMKKNTSRKYSDLSKVKL